MSRIVLGYDTKASQVLPPINVNGGKDTDSINMAGFESVCFEILVGVTSASSSFGCVVMASSDASQTGETSVDFAYRSETTGGGDTLAARTEVDVSASESFSITNTSNTYHIIEVRAEQLPENKPWVHLQIANPGASSIVGVMAHQMGDVARDQRPTSIA